MTNKIERLITDIYNIPYSKEAFGVIDNAIKLLDKFIDANHFINVKQYRKELEEIATLTEDLSSFKSDEDRLLQKKIQKRLANLARTILDENKKIFIVHGRNISMRDKVSSMLGKLKLDYVILETEYNNGATVIEKFLREAKECKYAVVLFSADDIGKLNSETAITRNRTRQNVILELGYFLAQVGRSNIIILHEANKEIEKPSDFDGIVYEPFDEFGAWKGKLVKEMKRAKIYIDAKLADRI
ncbi:MAG TPA: nucleotide-binding protein [Crocinitomicaceae bacterium]|nr:nucleotide-binding protein [Crocinitomicaceae bacterium]